MIQLGYLEPSLIGGMDEPRALLLRVHSLPSLPQALVKLLNDETVVLIGRGVGGDIAKMNRDFGNSFC